MFISTRRAIELAFAAKRVNGKYIKDKSYGAHETPNKHLMIYSAFANDREAYPNQYVPEGFEPLEITDEDRRAVDEADKHMRRYVLLALGGLNQFQEDMFSNYSSEEIPVNRLGFIAYFPYFVERELDDIIYKQRLKKEFSDSQHRHDIKMFDDTVEVLKCIHLKDYGTYLHIAGAAPNLYLFGNKTQSKVGTVLHIRARIASFQEERETKLPITRLNYVNILKRTVADA